MKKIVLLIILVTNFTIGQESFRFQTGFQPNSEYLFIMKTKGETQINFFGDSLILANLKNNGIELPIISKNTSEVNVLTKTGEVDSQNAIQAIIEYQNSTNKIMIEGELTEQKNPISGTTAYGRYLENNHFEVDSINNSSISEETIQNLKQTINQVQQNINFPDRELVLGDSFTNIIPLNMPIKNMAPIEILIVTDYTLIEVKNNLAKFNLIQEMELKSSNPQLEIKLDGEGKGYSEFNIQDKTISKHHSDISMTMIMTVNEKL